MRGRRLRGLRCPRYARRIILGTFAATCAASASPVATALSAQAASKDQEIGTLHWGSAVVWLRATDAGVVELYAATGYRSAFVQPVVLTNEDVEQWAALIDQLSNPAAPGAATASTATSPTGNNTGATHAISLASGDLVLEVEQTPASEPKLRVWVGASRPDAVVGVVVPEGAEQAAHMLRDAARVARSLHETAVALAQPPAESVPAPSVAPSDLVATQTHVSTAPSEPVATTLSTARQQTTTVVAFETPSAPAAPVARTAHAHATVIPALKTTTTTTPTHVTATTLASVTTVNNAPQHAHEHPLVTNATARPTPAPASHPAAPATTSTATATSGIDDGLVQNLIAQWRPDLMVCYTEYGLREHASLAGALSVRFAVSPNGAVGRSIIESRSWNGDGSAQVESCILSHVAAWHFPPASAGSVHMFNLQFAPGRG